MIKLIPMAGAGSRFVDEGYKLPKPLIPVLGQPMSVLAAKMLPPAEKNIFICRQEHIEESPIQEVLEKQFSGAQIMSVNYLTEGQASTCLLAKEQINNSEELLIGACDNGVIWNHDSFAQLKQESDAIIWTFRNNVTVKEKPQQYGWVKVDYDNQVVGLSVKKAISDQPTKDHAIVGTFWFKQGSDFVRLAEKMIQENDRVNNEFYVDQCLQHFVDDGLKVKVFEVESYICWGTPNDLRTFEYWESFFKKERYFEV